MFGSVTLAIIEIEMGLASSAGCDTSKYLIYPEGVSDLPNYTLNMHALVTFINLLAAVTIDKGPSSQTKTTGNFYSCTAYTNV